MGNQLIIIGNGFDRACGLKSTYDDFFKYLAKRSSTTENGKDNIWNHIFKFLHDVNSLVHFFRDNHYWLKVYRGKREQTFNDYADKIAAIRIRRIRATLDERGQKVTELIREFVDEQTRAIDDEQIRAIFEKRIRETFEKQIREIVDERTRAIFDKRTREIDDKRTRETFEKRIRATVDEWIRETFDKRIQEFFDEWIRETFDERVQKEFAKQKEQILNTWKQADFDDWEQEDPDKWKDVESVIRDWAAGMLAAPNHDIGTTNDLKDIQWIIGCLLTGNTEISVFIKYLLDNPDKTLPSDSPALDRRVHDLLRRYSIPLKELLDWCSDRWLFSTASAADILFSELGKFESEFMDYMRGEFGYNPRYQQRARRLYRLISSTDAPSPVNDYVLSFNYTRPNTAGFTGIRCWRNVHGSLGDDNAIFGFDITDLQPEQRKDHDLIRFTKTYRVLQLPQKPTGQQKALEPVTGGGSFDAIKVYGHSLDRADYSYFKAIFDCVDLYSSNVKLFFFYPVNRADIGAGLYQSVSDLLTDYGDEMPDRGKGRNLMHRLLLENRLSVAPLDIKPIDEHSPFNRNSN